MSTHVRVVFGALFSFFLHAFLVSPSAVAQQYFNKSYAIVIGIDQVPNSRWTKLTYAEADARSVGNLLGRQGYEVTSLFGSAATKTNIGATVLRIAHKLTADDRVIVYFAGHGYSERLGNQTFGYLVPYDGGDNTAAYITMDEMRTFSSQMDAARHQLFIVDACFSGLLLTRSGGVDPKIPDYVSEIAKRRARQVIVAGGANQEVMDSGPDGHSTFTHALLEALDQGFADTREDGYICESDLISYLRARASNQYQTPAEGTLPGHGLGEYIFSSPKPAARRMASAVPATEAVRRGDTTPAPPQPASISRTSKYTMAEYNAYQAAAAEKNPAAQLRLLDDYVSTYPTSALLNYVYALYYKNYGPQKNFPKTIEYCDKLLALRDASPSERYEASYVRSYAYNDLQNPNVETAKAAREAALTGVQVLNHYPKPEGIDDAKFAELKKQSLVFFLGTAAKAASDAKDCAGSADSYKQLLAITPDDVTPNYNLGKAYMCMNPPQTLDALWSFARAATSKSATEQQSKVIKAYLRKVIANYQGGTVCDALTDAELNELLQLASSSVERPARYKLISSADLDAQRKDMTIAPVVTDLKAGGDKAKLTWTASCGLEFPDVPTKVIEVLGGGTDAIKLKVAFVTSDAEFMAATTPNMDVTITGQPSAATLKNGDAVRFTGTVESYQGYPFMLYWDRASINPKDLPKR